MNLKIHNSTSHRNNHFFTDYFQGQNRSIILLTHFRDEALLHEKINSLILERLVAIDFQELAWNILEDTLQEFFVNLNWELFALFRNVDGSEIGLSLFLVIIEDNKLFFISFGRFLTGLHYDNKYDVIGKKWENFHIKTKDELGLLGDQAKDITVKSHSITIEIPSLLLVFPAEILERIDLKKTDPYDISTEFAKLSKQKDFPYLLLNFEERRPITKRPWYKAKRFRITSIVLLLMLSFSLYYLFLGKDTVEDRLQITREQFQLTVRNIDVLKLQEVLSLDYGILLVPQRNIDLTVEWESQLPYKVSLKPQFDLRQLYLTSAKTLYSYDKRTKNRIWYKEFDDTIIALEILDANLLLVSTEQNHSHCLKRDTGELVWSRRDNQYHTSGYQESQHRPIQISLEADRRLNTSTVLFPSYSKLTLLNILNGDTLSYYESKETIHFVSDYDFMEKSVYMIEENRLHKIKFDVRN